MTLYSIVLKNMKQRALASMLTVASIALGVALVTAILLVNTEAKRNFYSSSTGWDLVVGPKGSPLELVLGAVFHVTKASNTVPYSVYEELLEDKRVRYAIPFCSGDSYQNFRVVATVPEFFERYEHKPPTTRYYRGREREVAGEKLTLAEGSKWKGELGEATIGSFVAKSTRLELGSKFVITHGTDVPEEMSHERAHDKLPFTVVGILDPTGTPVDKVIYVSLDTWFHFSDHVNVQKGAAGETLEEERGANDHSEDDRHEHEPIEPKYYQLTSIGVKVDRDLSVQEIVWEMRDGSLIAQAVMPRQEIELFFQNVLGWVSALFVAIAGMVIIVSGIGVMVWIYNSMNERRRDIAIMRSLGAGRWTVFGTILFESMTLCTLGALVGIPLAHAGVQLAGDYIHMKSGAIIDAWSFSWYELYLFGGTIALGAVVGILPAVKAYETDVADNLRPLA